MPGPFHGIRILDFSSVITGPLATMTLADQGADVIKVETLNGGDHTRRVATHRGGFSASFLNNNRNKRSIALDLKHADGLAAAHRLMSHADMVVQNFRPGVADRIGIGEARAREIRSDVIYVSIAGFGFEGPYASKPTFDPLVQAVSGLTTVQAGSDEDRPRLVRTIVPDKLTAIQASQAMSAALFARERTGKGQHVRISMLDTVVAFLWASDMGGHTFVGEEHETERAQSYIDLIYETADGHISVAVLQDKEWRAFAEAMDRPDLLVDPRFASAELREINKNERLAAIQDAVRPLTSGDALARLEARDVPCAPVLTRREMIGHPQIAANALIVETDHPVAGRLRQARQPARFSETPAEFRTGAPVHGAHTSDVLAEAGFTAEEIAGLIQTGAALQGRESEPA